ncbi:MAG: SDR family oxidoreductase [Chloroflexi bacterium]|nr:SDR family oxidoreductase [Chloroflexota bacterium]
MVNAMEKIAVVGGGGGGIGRAVASRLCDDGFLPLLLDQNESAGTETLSVLAAKGRASKLWVADVSNRAQVREAFDNVVSNYGRIDLLVNLAGGTMYAHLIQDFPLSEWLAVIAVNLKGTFLCCQAAIPTMKRQSSGSMINTSSNYGITGGATRTAYAASKAGVIGFSKSLAHELAPHGIRVNTIAPGRTATARVMRNYTPESWAASEREIPMGRAGDPADIAEGVAFLASPASAYMTGQTLHVNGGMVLP